jgi:hypothetical protein
MHLMQCARNNTLCISMHLVIIFHYPWIGHRLFSFLAIELITHVNRGLTLVYLLVYW